MSQFKQILTKYWGYPKFRPFQEEIIQSLADGNDTLGLLPTGGGKSITFQVFSLSRPGLCIVVTPLIALMKDQVENLKSKNIKAVAIFSGMSKGEISIALDNCMYADDIKFLYVSPERLATEQFKGKVQHMNVNLIAIDEAHCISQWGYDFRPSYLKIAEVRQLLPNVACLAVTATATPVVVTDIQEKLLFKKLNLIQQSFERKNLVYTVKNTEDKISTLTKILQSIPGSSVVYVRSRKKTKEISDFLIQSGISSDYYHAGLDHISRDSKQQNWKKGATRVIVSTNAFGMGIDKADVRTVVHIDLPDSIEAYFQEAGRAGRDEKKAWAVLLYNESDRSRLEKNITDSFPEIQQIKSIYTALGNYFQLPYGTGQFASFNFNIYDFCKKFKFQALIVHNSLKILESEGYLTLTDEFNLPSKLFFQVSRDDLYKFQVSNAQFDAFIKLILRTYSGVFTDYVSIDENLLAKKALAKIEIIYEFLNKLRSFKIIDYIPRKEAPLVIYNEERFNEKDLFISSDNYIVKKERYTNRVQATLNYASSINKCRSQLLLLYFGEKDPYRCGQCDVCLKRNELGLSKYEFDLILEQIKSIVKEKPVDVKELVDKIAFGEEKIIKVIRWLLDNSKVFYNDANCLTWHK